MERKEAVRVVSRALSFIWGVSALEETTYLPERLISYVRYTDEWHPVDVGLLFVRIAINLALAVVFWKCGPWVERTLLSESEP